MKQSNSDAEATRSIVSDGQDGLQASSIRPGQNATPQTVPDGGTQAWLQVLGSFFLFFNTFGLINTFGVYQTYYETDARFVAPPATIAWIGSIQGFLLQFIGPVTGPLYDAGYFRSLLKVGSFMIVFGQMMLSFCDQYYQVLLAQAFCIGIGAGCLFLPCVAVLSQYFNHRLASATGLAATGSSLGGILYPIMLYHLLPQVGFAWATRILGFVALATLLVPVSLMRLRMLPPSKRRLLDLPAFQEPPYALFTVGCFFAWMGLYGPYFYVGSFSLSAGLAAQDLSFYFLPIINAGSVFGRLIPNYLADRTGPLNMIVPAAIISGILAFCLICIHDVAALMAISALYGFSSGCLVSLYSTVYIRLSKHKPLLIGTRMGMGLLTTSIALLLGTPICGWIIDASSFAPGWVFSGATLIAGGLIMAAARLAATRGQGRILVKA